MKKYLALGLLTSLLLTSCSVDWNDTKDKKIGELEKQVTEMKKDREDDFFKKKQECSKITEDIIAEWKKKGKNISPLNIKEIFYSRLKNSCIYAINETSLWGIYDGFSNESYMESKSPLACGYKKSDKECEGITNSFNAKIKELKGE